MLAYLQKLLDNGDTFTLDVLLVNGAQFNRCGTYSVDTVGLALECTGEDRLIPWSQVACITVEISG